ncbi:hypothetical protein [Halobacteriovorax sp. ZH4_bin.1]|uniref:hypothetical protein n=1 Tax=unclassified Halobacteriovorax TaxID=2639665 RepID=UPI00372137A6
MVFTLRRKDRILEQEKKTDSCFSAWPVEVILGLLLKNQGRPTIDTINKAMTVPTFYMSKPGSLIIISTT